MDHASIIRDYTALRSASIALSSRLVETLSREEIRAAADALGMLDGKVLNLGTPDELNVLMDYAIHNLFRDGRNAVDRMLEENPPAEGSLEMRLLRSQQSSHYAIVGVQKPIPGIGVVGLDVLKKTPIVLIDRGFSTTAIPGLALASRIHSPAEGWWMTCGAALPMKEEAIKRILREAKDYQHRFGVEPPEQERVTMVIRACVASGASQNIAYADYHKDDPAQRLTPVIREAPKVGRNEPCRCGSGRKFKKCCGK